MSTPDFPAKTKYQFGFCNLGHTRGMTYTGLLKIRLNFGKILRRWAHRELSRREWVGGKTGSSGPRARKALQPSTVATPPALVPVASASFSPPRKSDRDAGPGTLRPLPAAACRRRAQAIAYLTRQRTAAMESRVVPQAK